MSVCVCVSGIVGDVNEQNSIVNKYQCKWLDSWKGNHWWLVRVTLGVAFGFLIQILGDGGDLQIVTARKRSYWAVMFLHLSVILFTGGRGLCQGDPRKVTPLDREPWKDPPDRDPRTETSRQRPPRQRPSWTETPQTESPRTENPSGQRPPRQRPPRQSPPPPGQSKE